MNNKIQNIFLIGIATLTVFVVAYVVFGFYYIRYEGYFTALFSSALTPNFVYDSFYIFGHFLLFKLYAELYKFFPEVQWLSWFLYFFLFTSLYLIFYHLTCYTKKNKLLAFCVFLLVGALFIEHIFLFIFTKVSFVLAFSALFVLAILPFDKKLTLKSKIYFSALYILAFTTRTEPSMIMLLIVGLFYVFVLMEENLFHKRILKGLKLFLIPIVVSLGVVLYYLVDIRISDKFFKQIEPELEYELMSRNNMVDIGEMKTRIDSFRYMAVYEGMWGDATTNDADFLRSLKKESEELFSITLFNNGMSALKESILNTKGHFLAHISVFLVLLLILILNKSRGKSFKIILFELLFILILFVKSYKIKMVETALSPMLFASIILYLYYLIKVLKLQPKISIGIVSLVFVFLAFYQIESVNGYLNQEKTKFEFYSKKKLLIEKIAENKNIYLNDESSNYMFNSFRPFEPIIFDKFNRVYVFDNQHIMALEPYRTFLEKECNCDPNNYGEFFKFVKKGGDKNIFLFSEAKKNFLKEYLLEVHQINITFVKLPYLLKEEESLKEGDKEMFFYTVSNS